MPRERGLNYTPDADGYSFEDTAIGEAAQASFHRLASGYPPTGTRRHSPPRRRHHRHTRFHILHHRRPPIKPPAKS